MEAIGLYNFTSKEPDELSFTKSAVLKIMNMEEDPNWYQAEFEQKTGLIPANYIDMQPHSWYVPYCSREDAEERLLEKDESNRYIQPDGAYLVRQSVNNRGAFSLSVKSVDQVIHFRILCNDGYQFSIWNNTFPSINKLIEYHISHSVCKEDQPKLLLRNLLPSRKFGQPSASGYFIAQYDFNGLSAEELSFKCGEVIKKIGEEDANWWIGELRGRRGIFPSNYVQRVPQ